MMTTPKKTTKTTKAKKPAAPAVGQRKADKPAASQRDTKPAAPAKKKAKPAATETREIAAPVESVNPSMAAAPSNASPYSRPVVDLSPHGLSAREDRFVREYLVDLNGSQAYRRAFDVAESTARNEASKLLKEARVAAAVADGSSQLARRSEISAEETMRRISLIATADTRELMEVRVGSCRYCWGLGNRYHFTPAEMLRAEAMHAKMVARDEAQGDFDPMGGVGFNRNRQPNPECPECFGEGERRTVFKDSRTLSEAGALLFAGVKETKDGFEVKTHSIPDALQQSARRHGLFNDKLNAKVEVDAVGSLREFLDGRSSRLPVVRDED